MYGIGVLVAAILLVIGQLLISCSFSPLCAQHFLTSDGDSEGIQTLYGPLVMVIGDVVLKIATILMLNAMFIKCRHFLLYLALLFLIAIMNHKTCNQTCLPDDTNSFWEYEIIGQPIDRLLCV